MYERARAIVVLLTVGCGASSATPVATPPRPHDVPLPAFVIAWTDRTLVVTLDGSADVESRGIWIADASGRVSRTLVPDAIGLPPCACPADDGACDEATTDVFAAGETAPSSECACYGDFAPTFDADDTPDALAQSSIDPGGLCAGNDADLSGIDVEVAGLWGTAIERVNHPGPELDCDLPGELGMTDVRDVLDPQHAAALPSEETTARMRTIGCASERPARLATANWRCHPARSDPTGSTWEPWGMGEMVDCAACDVGAAAITFGVRSGWIFQAHQARELVVIDTLTATPDVCPTAQDPCGDVTRFPSIASRRDPEQPFEPAFWVASDASSALVADGDRADVFLPGASAAARSLALPADVDSALGVRFHTDARALIASMRATASAEQAEAPRPAHAPRVACSSDAMCASGDGPRVCAGGLCVPPCHEDDDCFRAGLCNAFCTASGRCGYMRDGACSPAHPCDAGSDCDPSGHCAAHVATLAPADATFVDRHGGRDWGNRCFAHVRAGENEAAIAACMRGLDVATDDGARAAILYSLGRAYEALGWTARAIERYEASLQLRDDDTVRQALETIDGNYCSDCGDGAAPPDDSE